MYLGFDIGTSAVKALLVDDEQKIVAQRTASLAISRPHDLWSEQDPESWWQAVEQTVAGLQSDHDRELSAVRAIGLAGQMHGATLLDDRGRVLRPAILWNDGRSMAACREIETREPRSRQITGNLAMPGFTAPKLLWVAEHEPEIFAKTAKVLLPKDYIRYRLTADYVSEMSDAAGTLWLDVGKRDWSDAMLAASGLKRAHMPDLVEGSARSGILSADLAQRWGMGGKVVIAGGAGDNAAGAVGVGTVSADSAFLSLGTSGVLFVANAAYSPNPEDAVHAFCHCLPNLWHQMSVILSAASCLSWVARLTGAPSEAALLDEIEATGDGLSTPLFLPYLTGERTPHNDPNAKGVFFGLTPAHDRAAVGRAVLEGVSFAFADGQRVLLEAGAKIDRLSVIGGGARSLFWGKILASALGRDLVFHKDADVGPAYGAARLGRLAVTGEPAAEICLPPEIERVVAPDPELQARYHEKQQLYRSLYSALKPLFAVSQDGTNRQ